MSVRKAKGVLTRDYRRRLLLAMSASLIFGVSMIAFSLLARPEYGNRLILLCLCPGLVLIGFVLYALFIWQMARENRDIIQRSASRAPATIIDRKEFNISTTTQDPFGLVFWVISLIARLLREDRKVVVEYEATDESGETEEVQLEVGVSGDYYERHPPGAQVSIRYASEDPQIIMLEDDGIHRQQPGWGFWLFWVLSSTVGFALGLTTTRSLVSPMLNPVLDSSLVAALGAVVFGAIVGFAQWLVIRLRISAIAWWVLATTLGIAVGTRAGFAVPETLGFAASELIGFAILGAVLGATLGLMQWIVLRKHVLQSGWWVLASVLGYGLGFGLSGAVMGVVVGAFIGAAAVAAAMTGGILIWLLRLSAESQLVPSEAT